MTTAAERLALLDDLPAVALCQRASMTLDELVHVMNEETTLLRAGRLKDATALTAHKTELAQDYVGLVRSIQRQTARLLKEAPAEVRLLRAGHERLATQMAENLKVLATAREVTETVLTDTAQAVAGQERTKTYGATGTVASEPPAMARGLVVNRAG